MQQIINLRTLVQPFMLNNYQQEVQVFKIIHCCTNLLTSFTWYLLSEFLPLTLIVTLHTVQLEYTQSCRNPYFRIHVPEENPKYIAYELGTLCVQKIPQHRNNFDLIEKLGHYLRKDEKIWISDHYRTKNDSNFPSPQKML